jgi:hypothetical protein
LRKIEVSCLALLAFAVFGKFAPEAFAQTLPSGGAASADGSYIAS